MAVSGRKAKDMSRSIATGSSEDFDHKCDPCLSTDQHIEAQAFCVTCQEYLCKICHDCHRRTKVSRGHQILGRDEFDKIQMRKPINECTEKCPFHQNEIIKFYCPSHAKLGCNDCMTIDHRACEIEYIPDKCVDIADGKEYNATMTKLKENLKEVGKICKQAEKRNSNISDVSKEIIKTISDFRKKINNRIDQLQHDILIEAERIKSSNKGNVNKVIDTCKNIMSDIERIQSNLCADKSNNQISQLYIDIKRAESTLQSDELSKVKEKLMNMNIHYSFRRSEDLKKLFSKGTAFGELINVPDPHISKKKKGTDRLGMKYDIKVKTKSDKQSCDITGCDVLSSYRLVLADYNNEKVKIVSVENKLVQHERVLDSEPFDIAVISRDHIAVTIPFERRIDVMTTDNKLTHVRSIKMNGSCYGITCHQDRLYVACNDPSSVVILTTQGSVLQTITFHALSCHTLPYIAVSKDCNLLFISDNYNNKIVSVSLQGDILATYRHEDLQGPTGMCFLEDGSLLVCCNANDTFHKVKGDLNEGKIMIKDIEYLESICYDRSNDEVYVGCGAVKLFVLSIK